MKSVLMLLFKDIHYDARVMREATTLARNGWKVYIACLNILTEDLPKLHRNIELIRIKIMTKRLKRSVDRAAGKSRSRTHFIYKVIRNPAVKFAKDVMAQREFCRKVIREMTGRRVQVIHCHDLNTLNIGVNIKKKLNIPYLIYDSHELYNEMNGKRLFEKQMGYLLEKKYITYADAVITVNEYLKDELEKRYRRSDVIFLRNCQSFYPIEAQHEDYFHRQYGLTEEKRIVLYQGGFTPSRGLEEFIMAARDLPDDIHLVLLGYGDLTEKLKQLVQQYELHGRVHFHRAVPPAQLLSYTRSADVGVVLYKNTCQNNYLSTPNKIFEYMQAEVPVVSSDHPGKSIIVQQAKTGVLVDPENPNAIAEGILTALQKKDEYVANCRKNKYRFSWDKEQEKLIELYAQLG